MTKPSGPSKGRRASRDETGTERDQPGNRTRCQDATTERVARAPAEEFETRDDELVVQDETGARFLRFWYFENGRAISCLAPFPPPRPTEG